MSTIDQYFSTQDLSQVRAGIRMFVRMLSLEVEDWQLRFVADETDLVLALRSVARSFHETAGYLGKRKYQGQDYDAPEEVRRWQESYLLTGRNESETARERKTNLMMYHIVIEPVISLFSKYDHPTILKIVDDVIADIERMVRTSTDYGTRDDALVAKAQALMLVRQREEQRKQALLQKRRTKRAKAPDPALIATLSGEDDNDDLHV